MLCLNFSVVCFDAKFNFDDSARFRQKEVFAMDDQSESDPREVEAGKYDLNYIGLDGNIACLGEMRSFLHVAFIHQDRNSPSLETEMTTI